MDNPGKYLKYIRKKRNLGVKAVYCKTGVGDSTIRNIEEGRIQNPSANHLKALADFYNINIVELYKAYGYLNEDDLKRKTVYFENADVLTDKEIATIQEIINLLAEKRTRK